MLSGWLLEDAGNRIPRGMMVTREGTEPGLQTRFLACPRLHARGGPSIFRISHTVGGSNLVFSARGYYVIRFLADCEAVFSCCCVAQVRGPDVFGVFI